MTAPAEPRRVGFLGPAGTFTEQALLTQADLSAAELEELPSIPDVLAATGNGDVDVGFVALENSIEGAMYRPGPVPGSSVKNSLSETSFLMGFTIHPTKN